MDNVPGTTTKYITALTTIGILAGILFLIWYGYQVPNQAPRNQVVTIEPGGVRDVAHTLKETNTIRSYWLFVLHARFVADDRTLQAGSYIFDQQQSITEIIYQLQNGENGARIYRLTHPEGRTVADLASRAQALLPDFDGAAFTALAEADEGRIFPETYYIPPKYTPEELHELLLRTYDERVIQTRSRQIEDHPLDEYEILILASILEREANTTESKRMVSGILQNRLAVDMPLQADASIEYVLDKPLAELTPNDLTVDSPYNTYINQGLPPTPINNPGLNAIDAVLDPLHTDYLYYITDSEGTFHYARDFDTHRANIETYLR